MLLPSSCFQVSLPPTEPRTDGLTQHTHTHTVTHSTPSQGDTLTVRRRPCSDTNLVPVLTQTSTFNFDAKFSCSKEMRLPRCRERVERAATVVRCQGGNAKAAMPLYSKRALAMVGSAHSPATQTNRGPRSQGLPVRRSTMGKARARRFSQAGRLHPRQQPRLLRD